MIRIKPKDGNKTFCMAPWTHTYLSPQMERRMCCASREKSTNFKQYIDLENKNKQSEKLHLLTVIFLTVWENHFPILTF